MEEDRETLRRLNDLLAEVVSANPFQRGRLETDHLETLADLPSLPFTSKDDLLLDQSSNPPFGTNLTYELDRYTLLFQTTGTTALPLRVLETAEDWTWWRQCFARVLTAAGLGAPDRIALASNFGPYVQFWAPHGASTEIGALTISLGGMDSAERLETIRAYGATALISTPSYALHLARRASEMGRDDALRSVSRILCTGEPGASLPAVRSQLERAWGARCFDHAGLSEVGSFSYPCAAGDGLHLNTGEFVFEVVDPNGGSAVEDGEIGELVVTAIGRRGFPVIRYRTGDAVRISPDGCPGDHRDPWLPEGIIGRTDDMVVIRGMNVYPSAIEQILHEIGGVGAFRITFYTDPGAMDEVKVEAEFERPADAREIQSRLGSRLGLRVRIVPVQQGILPVQEGKARHVEDVRDHALSTTAGRRDA